MREILDVGVCGVALSDGSLLAGFEAATVESITEVIICARQTP